MVEAYSIIYGYTTYVVDTLIFLVNTQPISDLTTARRVKIHFHLPHWFSGLMERKLPMENIIYFIENQVYIPLNLPSESVTEKFYLAITFIIVSLIAEIYFLVF